MRPNPNESPSIAPGWTLVEEARFRRVLLRGIVAALLAHAFFIALFALIDAELLAWVNVGSVGVYLLCVLLVRAGRYSGALAIVTVEVIAHAWLAVGIVGWQSGFHYYLLVLAPLVFFHPRLPMAGKLGYTALLYLAYAGLDGWARRHGASMAVAHEALIAIQYFNVAATLGFLAYFAQQYASAARTAEVQLDRLAGTDPLTGLHNRRRLIEIAEQELARHQRSGLPMSLIVSDIDDFKQVNDRYGHEAGDYVLQTVAARMRQGVRAHDHISRWGGEELLLLLPETDLDAARTVAEKLRAEVAQPMHYRDQELVVTLTLGVSMFRRDEDLQRGAARADEAMLRGKRAGKNCVVVGV